MSRLGTWFRSSGKSDCASDASSTADFLVKEKQDLGNAMDWAGLIMNDDIDGAWEALQQGDSSFHELGSAVTIFMRSILGFEKDVIAETSSRLTDCETKAWADYKRSQKMASGSGMSKIYPPGTQYELARAETQLMGAVVGVLNESVIEAMRSFYKLRKAYITLEGIIEAEGKVLGEQPGAASRFSSRIDASNTYDDESDSGVDSDYDSPGERGSGRISQVSSNTKTDPSTRDTTPDRNSTRTKPSSELDRGTTAPEDSQLLQDPVDAFIHSGANMCFGILLLILTLVPPAFSRILSVVGFRGDRARGLRMLWNSAAYPNVNGAVAGMVLLQYYNGYLGRVDILPGEKDYDEDAEIVGPPREKLARLLADMRARYPDSKIWIKEESKQHAYRQDLAGAIDVLQKGKESKIKQITALNTFEMAIDAMFIQDWELMQDTFRTCIEVNDWSPATYTYMIGCAAVEMYRDAHHKGDKKEAQRHKAHAEECLRKAPTLAGKKRLMAQQLPFEAFLLRKLARWESRAAATGEDLVDVIGPSPALEMCYMWTGQKRMGVTELARGVGNLRWERCTASREVVEAMKSDEDEMAVWSVSMAAMLRRLGRCDEARALLAENVLKYDRNTFKGPTKDDYVLPTATYEMGVVAWTECCNSSAGQDDAYRRTKLDECQTLLETAYGWESFVLDSRIGLRAQSGLETVKWLRRKNGW